jgi:hypothetical protein
MSDSERWRYVSQCIMDHLDGDGTRDEELRRIASGDHHADCGLGGVPACTCGQKEARAFVALVDASSELEAMRRPSAASG